MALFFVSFRSVCFRLPGLAGGGLFRFRRYFIRLGLPQEREREEEERARAGRRDFYL